VRVVAGRVATSRRVDGGLPADTVQWGVSREELGTNGRRSLVGAGVVATLFAGIAGVVLGANSSATSTTVLCVVRLPVTSVSPGLYGLVLGGTLVASLFGLVTLASRLEE
jgi:hypothetical protein